MELIILIGIGSGLGGICRYLLASQIHKVFSVNYPIGTLTVNVLGSFLIGCMFAYLSHRLNTHTAKVDAFFVVGFLGGFTTFSAFSVQTIQYLQANAISQACSYMIISVASCIIACGIGMSLSKKSIEYTTQYFNSKQN